MLTPDYLTTNQSEECPWADHALLLEHFQTPHYPLLVRIHSFEGISPLWPPLPGKAIKLFSAVSKTVSSVQFSCSVVSDSLRPHRLQHTRPPCPSPTPGVYSNSCPLSQWCHPTVSSSVILFSSCPQSFPASGSFQMSQFLTSGGQSIGVSASVSVLPVNIQDWFPLGWTGWVSLQSRKTLKSLLQHHSSKASVLQHSAFFTVQLSHPYSTTGKTIALTLRFNSVPGFRGQISAKRWQWFPGIIFKFLKRCNSQTHQDLG